MVAKIIDGKALAAQIRHELTQKISADNGTIMPVLAVVLVGENEASKIYVRNKKKAAHEVGIGCEVFELSESIGERALLEVIDELNGNHHINGIIVQLPLPKHINTETVIGRIRPEKDVDGFHPYNLGLLAGNNHKAVVSATPKGILRLLQSTGIELSGKHAIVIGRSNIVGRPVSMLLLNNNCTVTIAHSKTQNLPELTQQADIVIAACGQAKMVKKDWIKKGAVIIDVGINRVDSKLCGDVDFDAVSEQAAFITPVPGGVGPMTVAMLLENTFEAYKKQTEGNNCNCGHHHCNCHH